jgi:uncharacterized membrane protein
MSKKDFEKNVIVAVFKVESEGYQALTALRQAASSNTYLVSAAALLKKKDGICYYLDGFDTGAHTANDTMIGGLIGMAVGLLAGPLGVLLGGSYGALIGSAVDVGDSVFGESMLDQMAAKLDDDMVAIVALAQEESHDALDAKLSIYDSVVARFDAEAVAAEVDQAYEAQAEMARHARAMVRKQEKEEVEEMLEENSEILRKGFTK